MRALIAAVGAISFVTGAAANSAPPPAAGGRAYQKCYSCHAIEPGKNDLEGPTLRGIVGKRIAAERFDYSSAMRRFAAKRSRWTADLLERYVADPEAVVPGTRMNFPGMRNAAERKALLEYLRKLPRQPTR